MKPFSWLMSSLGLLCSSWCAVANVPAVPIYEIKSQETFIQAPLDHQIYFYSRNTELGDLQVIDAKGNKLPFRIAEIAMESQNIQREIPAVFFPVAPNTSEELLRSLGSTSIQVNSEKVQVEIIESSIAPAPKIDTVDFYLIDLKTFHRNSSNSSGLTLKALKLGLPQEDNSYQTWSVSGSNDLRQWTSLSTSSLVQLRKEGHALIQDKIRLNLEYQDFGYLKLRCEANCSSTNLSSITIIEDSKLHFFPADMRWTLAGEASSKKVVKLDENDRWQPSTAYEFIRDDVAPIENFAIDLGEQLYGDRIRLLARNRSQDAWQLLYQGIWFNTKLGQEWHSSKAQPLYGNYRQFRLELLNPIQTQPQLVFYTKPKWVQFIGNDSSPYSLVVSTLQEAESQTRILDSLLNSRFLNGQSPGWVNHQWVFLNPPKPESISSLSWRSLVFWGVLTLAVVLLALLSIKLFRQMNVKAE